MSSRNGSGLDDHADDEDASVHNDSVLSGYNLAEETCVLVDCQLILMPLFSL